MKNISKYIKYILPVIIIVLIATANYWVFGILSLFDSGTKNTIHELEPLMEEYLEQKYGGEMKLWSVGRSISGGISATARRPSMPQMDFFNIRYTKKEDGSYEFSDTYYEAYLRYSITNRLNEISKEIFKETFKSGFVFSTSVDFYNVNLTNIDIPLGDCLDIIKYNFAYSVDYTIKFDETKIEIMYDLLKTIYESEIIPFQISYSFSGNFNYYYKFSESDKSGDLINYEDFKIDILAEDKK